MYYVCVLKSHPLIGILSSYIVQIITLTSAMIFFHSLQINCEPPPDPPGGMTEATVVVSFEQSLAGQIITYIYGIYCFCIYMYMNYLILHTTT